MADPSGERGAIAGEAIVSIADAEVELTPRGFEIIRFTDHNDRVCSLQQSSLALYAEPGSSAVWLGVDGDDRMHLTVEMAYALALRLLAWSNDNSFALADTAQKLLGAFCAELFDEGAEE